MKRSLAIRLGIRTNTQMVFLWSKEAFQIDPTGITDKYNFALRLGKQLVIPRRALYSFKNTNELVQMKNENFNVLNPFDQDISFQKNHAFEQEARYYQGIAFNLQT